MYLRSALPALLGILLAFTAQAQDELPFSVEPVTSFDQPWALTFLPDGRMLVTEKTGNLRVVTQAGAQSRPVEGLPDVDYRGQGGLGDVILHPEYADNGIIYLSYAESGAGDTRGAAVVRAVLELGERGSRLSDAEVIWRQYPKVLDDGHLWVSSGDRQKFTPAQDMQSNMGKILRLEQDGSIPADNPFVNYREDEPLVDGVGPYDEIWTLGH